MGVLRLTFELIFVTGVIIVIIANIPTNVLFEDFPLEPISFEAPSDIKSVFDKVKWDNVLGEKGELLLKDKIIGPESMVISRGFIYTGLADGRIIEIDKESLNFRVVARIVDDPDCYDFMYWKPSKCGRPLGMRLDQPTGNLIVVDPYFGVLKVWVKSGKKEVIAFGEYSKRPQELKGLLNDMVLDPVDPNILYVTLSTSRWGLDNIVWSIIEHENSGKVFAVDLKTKKATKIVENSYLPNGIELSSDKTQLLFSECVARRIMKLNIDEVRKQLKTGKVSVKAEVFADNLPGEVDNLRLHNGEIYAAIALPRYNGPSISDRISTFPIVRKALGRTLYLTSKVIKFVRNSIYAHPVFEELEFMLSSGHILYSSVPKLAAIAVLDGKTGKLKKILGSDKFSFISEAVIDESNGDLYFGSFRNKFLGKLSIKNM